MARRGENITKRKDGRWEARIIRGYDCNRKARYKYLYGRSYAEVREKKQEYLCKNKENRNRNGDILLSSVLSEFTVYNRNRTKESTAAQYKRIIETHIRPQLGNYRLSELNSVIIDAFIEDKLQKGRIDQKGGLSVKTVRDILTVLKQVINFFEERGYYEFSGKISLPRKDKNQIDLLTKTEEDCLISYMLKNFEQTQIGVMIALCSGMRIGEICALRWENVDIKNETIFVRHTLLRTADLSMERKTKLLLNMLGQQRDEENSLQRRVADFKKALSKNKVLEEFDRGIFESIIEKVIIGGYDESGNKDPYKITFIYKTGFRNDIGNTKQRFDKFKGIEDNAKELRSYIANEVNDVCSSISDDECGDGC